MTCDRLYDILLRLAGLVPESVYHAVKLALLAVWPWCG